MKKPTQPKKLELSKETVRALHPAELRQAAGGITGRTCSVSNQPNCTSIC